MKIRLASFIHDSIVDGEGIRSVIFTQGCPHNCPGCHNQKALPFDGGELVEIDDVVSEILKADLKRVTFSGGEPFAQARQCYEISARLRAHDYNLWSYTGYTYDALVRHRDPYFLKFLSQLDIVIDGRFVLAQRSIAALYRGSSNQRIIDVPLSLIHGKPMVSTQYKDPEPDQRTRSTDIFI